MESPMDAAKVLSFSGLLLFLLGLLNGFAIPLGKSPRIGLSAHLTAVQSGTFLIAVGLLWPQLSLSPTWSAWLAGALALSLYAIWAALLLGGLFGAGRNLPIAGQGVTTTPAKQAVVTALMGSGSLAALFAVGAVLFFF